MMMIHQPEVNDAGKRQGRDSEGRTTTVGDADMMLFDGQQRITAVLLGCNEGPTRRAHKLWVDLGKRPKENSDLKFQLRMSSIGQPFGYRADAPNERFEFSNRHDKWCSPKWNGRQPDDVFKNVAGQDLIDADASCVVPFASVWSEVVSGNIAKAIETFSSYDKAAYQIVADFVKALYDALEAKVLLQHVPPEIVKNLGEYIRFFRRVGQGGTQLSDDELSYSIIKHRYPKIHDRMAEIVRGTGHLADEIDLVLASLRVAKTLAPWKGSSEGEIISRPNPPFVSQLEHFEGVRQKFLELVPEEDDNLALLQHILLCVRAALSYGSDHPVGLPSILLGCLPRELVDVLIRFAMRRGPIMPWEGDDRETLRALVLYWLLFVQDSGKAARFAFEHSMRDDWTFGVESIRNLIEHFEKERVAEFLPGLDLLPQLRKQIEDGNVFLRSWEERFTVPDTSGKPKPNGALRRLSNNRSLSKLALMWLQRDYIMEYFPNFDPTSERDDALPIDLDHIIPNSRFGFHWSSRSTSLESEVTSDPTVSDNFYDWRGLVGHSLGNFRWLAMSDNRARRDNDYKPLPHTGELVLDPEKWIDLSRKASKWTKEHISDFQKLIDLRTLYIYEEILVRSGIEKIRPTAIAENR